MHTLDMPNDMTIYTAAKQKQQLLAFIESGDELCLNLSEVEELDTAGVQLLLLAQREATQAEKQLQFINPGPVVVDMLNLANLTEALGIAVPEQAL